MALVDAARRLAGDLDVRGRWHPAGLWVARGEGLRGVRGLPSDPVAGLLCWRAPDDADAALVSAALTEDGRDLHTVLVVARAGDVRSLTTERVAGGWMPSVVHAGAVDRLGMAAAALRVAFGHPSGLSCPSPAEVNLRRWLTDVAIAADRERRDGASPGAERLITSPPTTCPPDPDAPLLVRLLAGATRSGSAATWRDIRLAYAAGAPDAEDREVARWADDALFAAWVTRRVPGLSTALTAIGCLLGADAYDHAVAVAGELGVTI